MFSRLSQWTAACSSVIAVAFANHKPIDQSGPIYSKQNQTHSTVHRLRWSSNRPHRSLATVSKHSKQGLDPAPWATDIETSCCHHKRESLAQPLQRQQTQSETMTPTVIQSHQIKLLTERLYRAAQIHQLPYEASPESRDFNRWFRAKTKAQEHRLLPWIQRVSVRGRFVE